MRFLVALLIGCLTVTSGLPGGSSTRRADAGEEEAPAPAPSAAGETEQTEVDRLRIQRDRVAAGVIGRGLVSPDEKVRRKAIDRLVARLQEGGSIEPFLSAMGEAIGSWANEQERLMEVWLDQAVNGTAEERDRAVLLLTALGAKAVRRLALELRHRDRHAGPQSARGSARARATTRDAADLDADASKADDAAKKPGATDSSGDDAPQQNVELAAGLPRRHDVSELLALGWDHFKLRNIILREANAVSATPHADDAYIVTAQPEGHEALRVHLLTLRAKTQRQRAPQKPKAGMTQAPADGETGESAGSSSPSSPRAARVVRAQSDVAGRKSRRPAPVPVPLNRAAPDWRIAPEILHLPRGGLLAARLSAESGANYERSPIERTSDVVVGTMADARRWASQARKLPDARAELPLQGTTILSAGRPAHLFVGKEIRYSKDVERTKGGAWRIVSDTVHHGIELKLVVIKEARALHVELIAQRTDVGLPMPVDTVRPSKRAAPVELERPQWSVTRVSREFHLPHDGGGVFVPLEGLGNGSDDHVVLVLGLEPFKPEPAPQQAAAVGGER